MENSKALLVVNAIVNKENMSELPQYIQGIGPVFAKNGGKPVGQYKTIEQIAGEDSPEMVSIVEFENAETIRNLVNSEEFQALSELRSRVFSKLNLVISQGA